MTTSSMPTAEAHLLRLRGGFLEWTRILEIPYLNHPALRWMAKVLLDLASGVAAVLVTISVDGNRAGLLPSEIARLAFAVGLLLVLAHVVRGSHRTIWRYTSLREASGVALSAAIVGAALMAGRALGWVPISGVAVLSVSLLSLFNALGVRAIRRWQVARPKRRQYF